MAAADPRARALKLVGSTLNEKWRLDRLIDVGGMAAVFEATHRNSKRAAVKLLHPEFGENSVVRERFLREGYAANRVEHPGAVSVLDDDATADGSVFLVMELLEGYSVEDVIRRAGGRIGAEQTLRIAADTLDVLAAAHTRGIIHRDLKPANLFVTRQGQVKLLDFGLARLVDPDKAALTRKGVVLGTSSYMPPEQAKAKWSLVDGRSDLFALGAVMFRCLSGQVVHEGANLNDRIYAAMTERVRSLAVAAPDVHPAVVAVVDKALVYEREGRYDDARQMQLAVERALQIVESSAPPHPGVALPEPSPSDAESAPPPAMRRPFEATTASADESLGVDVTIEYPAGTRKPGS
jgi:eukaryotic-like serine/threonine-protein kinase